MIKKATQGEREAGHLTPGQYLLFLEDNSFLEGLWRDQSACAIVCRDYPHDYEPDDWFPGSSIEVPKNVAFICGECEVRLECLAYAIRTKQETGIWAGKSERTLKQIRKRLTIAIRKMDQQEARELARHKLTGKGQR